MAAWAAPFVPTEVTDRIREGAVREILTILASSMLVVATFSLGTMVQAFAAAAQIATPRATQVLIDDPLSQNVLSTFLGAFVFGMVSLIAHSIRYYGPGGEAVLMAAAAVVVAVVITTFFSWLDHLANMVRLGETMRKLEVRSAAALAANAAAPRLRGAPLSETFSGWPLTADSTAYVRHVDIPALAELAEAAGGRIALACLPGTLVDPTRPMVSTDWPADAAAREAIRDAFTLGPERSFDQDPRFCLAVLTEIASRALSPGVNDPGTAIGVITTQQRLLSDWAARAAAARPEIAHPAVLVPEIGTADLMEDAFGPLVRDAAGILEVGLRLQKTLSALVALDPGRFGDSAAVYAARALAYAEAALPLDEDRRRLAAEAAELGRPRP